MNGDPPPCTVGFLPPSQWRSPADETVIDTPDDLYCKLPQDSPIAVRGVRNNPCMGQPGKRAPTVEICNSDQQYQPLAMRQHVLGPYPFDPNLISQGVPPDGRASLNDNTYAPIEGTPMPPRPRMRFSRPPLMPFRHLPPMWRRRTTIRAPADTSVRTETSTSRATWQNSRRPSAIYSRTELDQIGSSV